MKLQRIFFSSSLHPSSYIFASFYPWLQQILNPATPHHRFYRLQNSPLLSHLLPSFSFPSSSSSSSSSYSQPIPTAADFNEYVNFFPLVEGSVEQVAFVLPHDSSDENGLVIDVAKGVINTHKVGMTSMPSGTLLNTGLFPAELKQVLQEHHSTHHRKQKGVHTTRLHSLWYSGLFKETPCMEQSPLFPTIWVQAWSTRLYSTSNASIISSGLSFSLQFRPSIAFPKDYIALTSSSSLSSSSSSSSSSSGSTNGVVVNTFPVDQEQPSESLAGRTIPMDIVFEIEKTPLRLLPEQYKDFLQFFFFNLGERPTVCTDNYTPLCPHCHWPHGDLSCTDCWCVLSIRLHRFTLRPKGVMHYTETAVGQLRGDVLDLQCNLHNTFTDMKVTIPTLFAADQGTVVIYPTNLCSYGSLFPVNADHKLNLPALEVTDRELMDKRELCMTLNQLLLNVRPSFLLSLYSWFTEPLWDVYAMPQAANWPPGKLGKYMVNLRNVTLTFMQSTHLPEPSFRMADRILPPGGRFFNIPTNANRTCLTFKLNSTIDCTMEPPNSDMSCSVKLRVEKLWKSHLLTVFTSQRPDSVIDIELMYKSVLSKGEGDNQMGVMEWKTDIQLSIHQCAVYLNISDLSEIADILSFQLQSCASQPSIPQEIDAVSTLTPSIEKAKPLGNNHKPLRSTYSPASLSTRYSLQRSVHYSILPVSSFEEMRENNEDDQKKDDEEEEEDEFSFL